MTGSAPDRQGERGFSLLLVVFSVTAFWQSYAISGFTGLSTAGVFPMLASTTMLLASVCIMTQSCLKRKETLGHAIKGAGFLQTMLPLRLVIVLLLITAYVIAMPILGFILSSSLFLFLSFSYLWRKSMVISSLITIVSVVSVYLVFRKLFQVVLPKGWLVQGWF